MVVVVTEEELLMGTSCSAGLRSASVEEMTWTVAGSEAAGCGGEHLGMSVATETGS